jgi:hypothetical protein
MICFATVLRGQQEVNGNDSDAELSVEDNTLEPNVNLNDTPLSRLIENGKKPSNLASSHETPLSVGEILLSLDAGVPLPGRAAEYSKDRHSSKPNGIQQHVKRTNLWGRSNVSNKSAFLLFFSSYVHVARPMIL